MSLCCVLVTTNWYISTWKLLLVHYVSPKFLRNLQHTFFMNAFYEGLSTTRPKWKFRNALFLEIGGICLWWGLRKAYFQNKRQISTVPMYSKYGRNNRLFWFHRVMKWIIPWWSMFSQVTIGHWSNACIAPKIFGEVGTWKWNLYGVLFFLYL